MNAIRPTECAIVAVSATLLAAASGPEGPLAALAFGAALVAGTALLGGWVPRFADHLPRPGRGRSVRLLSARSDGVERSMGRTFRTNHGSSAGESRKEAESGAGNVEDEEAADSREAGSRAYEEFAAGLEEDEEEEISFLPPYASRGNAGSSDSDEDGSPWLSVPAESPLLSELLEVLDPECDLPMPRRFALGTVAVLKGFLDPSDLERILDEQRRYPRLRFGDIAVELGLLSHEKRDQVLLAQREGVFTESEIRDARARVIAYRDRLREKA